MQIVASELLSFVENQFEIGRSVTAVLTREQTTTTVDSVSWLSRWNRGKLRALCHLLDQLSPKPKPALWAILLEAQCSIEEALAVVDNSSALNTVVLGRKNVSPLRAIVEILRQTPDEYAIASDDRLSYILDPAFREQLLFDIGVAGTTLDHREWKASIIIAGAVIEALLLSELVRSGGDDAKLNCFTLRDLISEAEREGMFDKVLVDQLNAVRDYRNLIHPGRAIRESEKCTLGKAHAMYGVLNLVDEWLAKRFSGEENGK